MADKAGRRGVDEIGSARNVSRRPSAPKAASAAQKPAKPKSGMFYFISLLVSFGICGLFPATTLLMAACMLPTVIMYLLDMHPRRHATKTVAWANLAGALITAFGLWEAERGLATAFQIMMSPFTWALVLLSASIGWAIQYIAPRLVRGYLDVSLAVQEKDLIKRQSDLEKEWGLDIRDMAPLEELEKIRNEMKAQNDDTDAAAEPHKEPSAAQKEEGAQNGAPSS